MFSAPPSLFENRLNIYDTKNFVLLGGLLCPPAGLFARQPVAWDEAYRQADSLIARLSLDEKIDFARGYSSFFFYGVPEKGIPYLYLSDATQGVHLRNNLPDSTMVRQLERSTAFPCPIMLASSFDPGLAFRYAEAVGEECRAGGIEVLLGPGLNIAPQFPVRPQFRIFRGGPAADFCSRGGLCAGNAVDRDRRLPETLHRQRNGILPPPVEFIDR